MALFRQLRNPSVPSTLNGSCTDLPVLPTTCFPTFSSSTERQHKKQPLCRTPKLLPNSSLLETLHSPTKILPQPPSQPTMYPRYPDRHDPSNSMTLFIKHPEDGRFFRSHPFYNARKFVIPTGFTPLMGFYFKTEGSLVAGEEEGKVCTSSPKTVMHGDGVSHVE
eukprot:CAMPEP_0174888536 /NCGR_PEP_ID=MMETSP0167-20121228/3830_1 /TAXON_ID=38298 /ORGANISM="Rhodella maculata, Strain CCMP736" /LENGTH=164 /DNA_ID=CAMNT_0016125565 /DNA_START=185 /DNA_END=679 /DNA_ORIENTATION=-